MFLICLLLLLLPLVNQRIKFFLGILGPFCAIQEGAEELEEPKEIVYKEEDFVSTNSYILQKTNDTEGSKSEGYRNNTLERNGWYLQVHF